MSYAIVRTIWPIHGTLGLRTLAEVLAEVGIHVVAVNATGYWDSPFVLSLVNAIVVAGFVRGYGFALRVSVASALCVVIPFALGPADATTVRDSSLPWSAVLLTVAMMTGYARTLFGVALARDDERARLLATNSLLAELQRLTRLGPGALDPAAVVSASLERLRAGVDAHAVVYLLCNNNEEVFVTMRADGVRLASALTRDELPGAARQALDDATTVLIDEFIPGESHGFDLRSGTGMYAPLPGRDGVAGLVAIEHSDPGAFSDETSQLLTGLADTTGLALDNAVRFGRLRATGAQEERTRIARDLHDRLGQSLAYVAFELDRIGNKASPPLDADLAALRIDVRKVVSEVRETLHDLRTDVTDEVDLVTAVSAYAERVAQRGGLTVEVHDEVDERFPRGVEHELWRIVQEAFNNIERHSQAKHVSVTLERTGSSGRVRIVDDGIGFAPTPNHPSDAYGLIGMRERAATVGGAIRFDSVPGQGVAVTVEVNLT